MIDPLFHSGIQRLVEAWAALPGAARVPDRADFDPNALGRLLPRVFIAERRDQGTAFRLAGAWVEGLHGRPLKGAYLLEVWRRDSRLTVQRGLTQVFQDGRPLIFTADLEPHDGEPAPVQIAAAPLRGPGGAVDRMVGLYQPLTPRGEAMTDIAGLAIRALTPASLPGLRRAALSLAAVDGRRIA